MPRVFYSPNEIEPVLLEQRGYRSLLVHLKQLLKQVERDFERKEILALLVQNIDKVIEQVDRTERYIGHIQTWHTWRNPTP